MFHSIDLFWQWQSFINLCKYFWCKIQIYDLINSGLRNIENYGCMRIFEISKNVTVSIYWSNRTCIWNNFCDNVIIIVALQNIFFILETSEHNLHFCTSFDPIVIVFRGISQSTVTLHLVVHNYRYIYEIFQSLQK